LPRRDLIVVGASAGAVEVLVGLVRNLPPGFPAAVFIVSHFPSEVRSHLPEILSRRGQLLARHPRDGEPIYPGHIYVAPPNYHLVLEPNTVRLHRGPRENHFRPSIDPLFRSAARYYGRRVVGVILSGALADGVAGLMAVRAAGGVSVIQDPQDALLPTLPQTAREVAGADYVVTAEELAPQLIELVRQELPEEGGPTVLDPMDRIAQTAARDLNGQADHGRPGTISVFTCPECGGCLWQVDEPELIRFRCHVGHAYLADALLGAQSAALEAALWTAVRTFRERSVLTRQLAHRERAAGNADAALRFEEESRLAEQYGELIARNLLHTTAVPSEQEGSEAEPAGGVSGEGTKARKEGS
jgi:two-component system chemotaxis response regulator CheB